jgi:hypothetical protein
MGSGKLGKLFIIFFFKFQDCWQKKCCNINRNEFRESSAKFVNFSGAATLPTSMSLRSLIFSEKYVGFFTFGLMKDQ